MKIQIVAFIIFIAVNLGIDLYIYRRIICLYFKQKWAHILFWVINAALLGTIITMMSLIRSESEYISQYVMIWILFVYFIIYIPKIIYLIFSVFDYVPLLFKKKKSRIFSITGTILAVITCCGMVYGGAIGRYSSVVNKLEVPSEKLPSSFDGYRVVLFSDIHLENFGDDTRFINQIVDQINEQQPDLIVFTGDLVNRKSSELEPFMSVLSRLRATDGVYSILGNHDYGDYVKWKSPLEKEQNLQNLKDKQRELGWTLLNNESVFLHRGTDSIALIGVENWGEPPFPQHGNLRKAYPNMQDDQYKLLLTHNPVHWDKEVITDSNIDLALSGHTHAMQIKLGVGNKRYSPSSMKYPRWSGLYQHGKQHLYVNEGIGCVFLPMRVGASPEITVLTLKRTN